MQLDSTTKQFTTFTTVQIYDLAKHYCLQHIICLLGSTLAWALLAQLQLLLSLNQLAVRLSSCSAVPFVVAVLSALVSLFTM